MSPDVSRQLPASSPESFAEALRARHLVPLWDVLGRLVPDAPMPESVAALFRYADVRTLLLEAGRHVTPCDVERRVLVLENPALPGQSRITQSLYAGLQLILPGETAPPHRHVASALRFVVEGHDAFTTVDGERAAMQPGDLILTPSWTWHEHGNPGSEPVVWLDGLDLPIVNLFNSSFLERRGAVAPPPTSSADSYVSPSSSSRAPRRERRDSSAGPGLRDPDAGAMLMPSTPAFRYAYVDARAALTMRHRAASIHSCHGIKLEYVNPATGGAVLPTIGAWLQLLPRGFIGQPHRATDATVVSVVEGQGVSTIGDERIAWGPKDVFVVPSWASVTHAATDDAVLFSMSDRPAQQALGIWRGEAD